MTAAIGREPELGKIERFLAAARDGRVALVVEGEAGIGKTTLYREALRLGADASFLTLSCRPAQAEAKLAYASLADLLAPVDDAILDELSEPQQHALDVALLKIGAGAQRVDQRAVAAALSSVLTLLGERSPLLVAIDDAQWLDRASAAAFAFAFRRIDPRSPTAVLVAVRAESGRGTDLLGLDTLPFDRLQRMRLGPLSLSALYHTLRQHLGLVFPRPTLQRIADASRGNPLFALEIARLLDDRGIPPVGEPLPVPRDVETLIRRRVRHLPAVTREVLLALALLAKPRTETVRAALGRAIDVDLEPALEQELILGDARRMTFVHPLYAAAVETQATAAERRRIHRRLAGVLNEGEERARHLALAADGPDEDTAAEVDAAAAGAGARGAPASAAELIELALQLTIPGSDEHAARVFHLARHLLGAGEAERARTVLESIGAWERWPAHLCAPALELRGVLGTYVDTPESVAAFFERVLADPLPPLAMAVAHVGLSYSAGQFDAKRALAHAEAGLTLIDQLPPDEVDPEIVAGATTVTAFARLIRGFGLDTELLDRTLALEAQWSSQHAFGDPLAVVFARWFKWVDDLDTSRRWLTGYLERTAGSGYEMFRAGVLAHLADTERLAGNLREAREHALGASSLAQEIESGALEQQAAAALGRIEALLGNAAEARALCADDAAFDSVSREIDAGGALGLLELAETDYAAADQHLRHALELFERAGFGEPGQFRVHADAAEAAVAVGDVERAAKIGEVLERHGARTGRASSLATGARVHALVLAARGDVDAALVAADEALERHADLPMPFEHGRTLLVKGVIERRLRRRGQAKVSFEQAVEIFQGIGARQWAARGRNELERVGLRRSSGNELTESEQRVAELTARGLRRREVAAALYVSPKTVDATLARVYRKLGVHSRAELGARMVELVQE